MEKNRIIKKRLHDETSISEENEPAAKKQKTEAMPIDNINNLPTKMKEEIIKRMDIVTSIEIGKTSRHYKNLVLKHFESQIKNPFAFFSAYMLDVNNAINTLINVWLYGEFDFDEPGENLYIKDCRSKEDLLPKIDYDMKQYLNEYELILNLITRDLIVTEEFFFKNLIDQIQQRGLDINTQGPRGQTLLHFYCEAADGINNDKIISIKALIEKGANIFLKDSTKQTPLKRFILSLIQNFNDTKESSEKNSFPIILVELMLEKFDKATVIHALVNSLGNLQKFNNGVASLSKVFLYLNHYSDSEVKTLFHAKVEQSSLKKHFIQFLDAHETQSKINLKE